MAKRTATVNIPPVRADPNPGRQSPKVPAPTAPVSPAVARARSGAPAAHGQGQGSGK